MSRSFHRLTPALAACVLLGLGPAPMTAQITGCEGVEPYVFILLDTSSAMNRSAACSAAQYAAGECGYVCSGPECSTPTAGDHPGSKIYQTRQQYLQREFRLRHPEPGRALRPRQTLAL